MKTNHEAEEKTAAREAAVKQSPQMTRGDFTPRDRDVSRRRSEVSECENRAVVIGWNAILAIRMPEGAETMSTNYRRIFCVCRRVTQVVAACLCASTHDRFGERKSGAKILLYKGDAQKRADRKPPVRTTERKAVYT